MQFSKVLPLCNTISFFMAIQVGEGFHVLVPEPLQR